VTDQLTDQLRRYGDALEEHIDSPSAAMVVALPTRPRRRQVLAAAVAAVVLVGVGAFVLARDDASTVPVTTDDKDTTERSTTTTTAAVDEPTPTTIATGSPTTTSSTTTTAPARESHVRGSVDWIGRDPRGVLRVGACPSSDTALGCPSMVVTTVADDGSFDLTLPAVPDGARWHVAAYVAVPASEGCVFTCVWEKKPRDVVRSEVVDVEPNVDQTRSFSVSARVIDVFVRDRNGNPFAGGGVQATDARCQAASSGGCPEDKVPMFVPSSPADGAARLVLDTNVRYDLHGQAANTGWADPQWTNDGNEFWFSPEETVSGAELDEGHVFYVDGAPAESPSP